jgi:dihydrofolate reductase
MRELIVDYFVTVDGYGGGEGAAAYFGLLGPELQRWIDEESAKPQVVVMGRVTYQALAEISAAGAESDTLTGLPKIVISRTLTEPLPWANSRLVSAPAGEAMRQLKKEAGDPLRVIGSPTLVRSLLAAGLVDRLRLVVFPKILGRTGFAALLTDLPDAVDVELIATTVLDSRLVVLEYRPMPASA